MLFIIALIHAIAASWSGWTSASATPACDTGSPVCLVLEANVDGGRCQKPRLIMQDTESRCVRPKEFGTVLPEGNLSLFLEPSYGTIFTGTMFQGV